MCRMGEVGRYRQLGVHNLSCRRGCEYGIADVGMGLSIIVAFFCMFVILVGSVDETLDLLWRIERRCFCLHNDDRECRPFEKWKGRGADSIVSILTRQGR